MFKQMGKKKSQFYTKNICLTGPMSTVNVLTFQTLVACQTGLDKQCFWSSSLIRILPVCFSDKHFVNYSPDYHPFILEQKGKCSEFQNIYHIKMDKLNIPLHTLESRKFVKVLWARRFISNYQEFKLWGAIDIKKISPRISIDQFVSIKYMFCTLK